MKAQTAGEMQQTELAQPLTTTIAPRVADADDIEELYFSLYDLSLKDQRAQTWAFNSETRAALWRFNIQRYLIQHPDLSSDGRALLERGLSLLAIPGWLDIQEGSVEYPLKASQLAALKRDLKQQLPYEVVYEVFIHLGPEPIDPLVSAAETGKRSLKAAPFADEDPTCYCGGEWECGSMPNDWNCFFAWCSWTVHCGLFYNEVCWGYCKRTS